jgi:uncharacterized protein DUF6966
MKNLTKVKRVLDKVILLLEQTEELNWLKSFVYFRSSCSKENDLKNLANEIRRVYAGMGSFSDLVLYRDGKMLINETSQLDSLRRELFELIS